MTKSAAESFLPRSQKSELLPLAMIASALVAVIFLQPAINAVGIGHVTAFLLGIGIASAIIFIAYGRAEDKILSLSLRPEQQSRIGHYLNGVFFASAFSIGLMCSGFIGMLLPLPV